ncbi:hypothetical protein RM844_10570 [Streptomyces sp. DSM 44915]|uniref:Uncharacterized protein n=1 Tax=Streptomyces chisholmiae TaxID=3075540 RepID=A0ABU2JPA1_9ACTN|nr:hypothetical protein [Streptomyces sp. DSM 44915]MDT0266737.1 hypothetical protein [Streptomyces sp. DSM 44915]
MSDPHSVIGPEVLAARRALEGIFLHGKQVGEVQHEIEAAGEAFSGVSNALFRNVVEALFTGHEPVEEIAARLTALQRAHPEELAALRPGTMSEFTLEQIGHGAPPPGWSGHPEADSLLHQQHLLIRCIARTESLDLPTWILGSCARYVSDDY